MDGDGLTCRELVAVVTEYLEGVLAPASQATFDAHLAECRHCDAYLDQMRTTIRLTGRLTEDDIPGEARETMLSLFRRWKSGR